MAVTNSGTRKPTPAELALAEEWVREGKVAPNEPHSNTVEEALERIWAREDQVGTSPTMEDVQNVKDAFDRAHSDLNEPPELAELALLIAALGSGGLEGMRVEGDEDEDGDDL